MYRNAKEEISEQKNDKADTIREGILKRKIKSNKGITLIALMITIIIILILVGVTLSLTLGERGIFKTTKDASLITKIKEIEEQAKLSYIDRKMEELKGGEKVTIDKIVNDLKEQGYKIVQKTSGSNTVERIEVSDKEITIERNTQKTLTYTLVYSDGTKVRYFVEVQGKNYEIIFSNDDIIVNTKQTNIEELNKEPQIVVESSDSSIISANKIDEEKIVLIAKDRVGDVEIVVKETNSNVTKAFTATTKIPATNITISQIDATIKVDGIVDLIATVEPSNTTDEIKWSSSNNNIALVTQEGNVTGIESGVAIITVTCGNQSKTCTVEVELFTGINKSETNPEGALPSGNTTIIEADASKGIVIKDKNNREWVWIIIPKTIFSTAKNNTDYAKIKADLITYAGIYRTTDRFDGRFSWVDEWYDGCGVPNSTTYNTMYNKMLKSVYENGGFWIQRYEDGTTKIRCADAQIKASGFSPDSTKTSSLLFGIQWDLVCRYLDGKDGLTTEKIMKDSTSWGFNSEGVPGQERNKKMNIYDFAGNCWEWTLEKQLKNSNPCVCRGGGYSGQIWPAYGMGVKMVSGSYSEPHISESFRATLY